MGLVAHRLPTAIAESRSLEADKNSDALITNREAGPLKRELIYDVRRTKIVHARVRNFLPPSKCAVHSCRCDGHSQQRPTGDGSGRSNLPSRAIRPSHHSRGG